MDNAVMLSVHVRQVVPNINGKRNADGAFIKMTMAVSQTSASRTTRENHAVVVRVRAATVAK